MKRVPITVGGVAAVVVTLVAAAPGTAQTRQWFEWARQKMVDVAIVDAGIRNPRVIEAMRTVPRHHFVPRASRKLAYADMALPIGHGQTISPPFVVAYMTESLDPQPTDKVLEIGTGSGYQAAVLSRLVAQVYSIEIVEPLARRAAETLKELGYTNVHVKAGDGFAGWPEAAPFDKIIVTCSPENVPRPLVEQLREGGRMVIPVGQRYQQVLYLFRKTGGRLQREKLRPTLFVPMTGRAEQLRQVRPDPAHPALTNGSFEELIDGKDGPAGWHYQRQLEVVEREAPSGSRYVRFRNRDAGRPAQALQGFAVDGRVVRRLQLSCWVRGEGIRPGPFPGQSAAMAILFYDENRQVVGEAHLGPWQGSFPWQKEVATAPVPPKAREAIVQIGLLGATGEICFDRVTVAAAPGRK